MKKILKNIVKELSKIEGIKIIFLYGSMARGEYTSRSDIDLLILTSDDKKQEEIQNSVIELESKIGCTIQPIIRTVNKLHDTDSGLLQNIFNEGKILYLREPEDIPSALLLKQKPHIIYSFKLNNLPQKNKVRFNRELYKQVRKNYKYPGLLNKLEGRKISSGCIIVPQKNKEKIEIFLNKFSIKFKQLKVWK